MKRSVRDLMKQRDLTSFPRVMDHATVEEALKVLKAYNSGSLLVLRDQILVGLFSERDFARAVLESQIDSSLKLSVVTLMKERVVYVTEDYTLEECLAIMAIVHVRHLPVLRGGKPIALLSMRHIMEALIEDREFMIDQLVKYVTGASSESQKVVPRILVREGRRSNQKEHLN